MSASEQSPEIEFPYNSDERIEKNSRYPESKIDRPNAWLDFKTKRGESQPIGGLIDSGADFTLIPFSTGVLLGLDVKKGELFQLRGIGKGALNSYLHKLDVTVKGHTLSMTVAVASVDDIEGRSLPVLFGRTDLFDYFDIVFRQNARLTSFIAV
jgi:hypothetical protein